jgi:hypothetical protein
MTDQISELAALYSETGNSLYAWEALTLCKPHQPLPRWIFVYLQGCAHGPVDDGVGPPPSPRPGVLDLDDMHRAGAIDATKAKDGVARALGIVQGNNGNAFADKRIIERDAAMAFHMDTRRGRKRWGLIQTQTGLSRGHILAGVKQARQRWAAQQKSDEDN